MRLSGEELKLKRRERRALGYPQRMIATAAISEQLQTASDVTTDRLEHLTASTRPGTLISCPGASLLPLLDPDRLQQWYYERRAKVLEQIGASVIRLVPEVPPQQSSAEFESGL